MALTTPPSSTALRTTFGRRSGRRVLLVAALVLGLLTPLFLTAPAASARTLVSRHVASAILRQINAERHAHGLHALRMNSHLVTSARRHDISMARYNSMSHRLPNEAYFATRMDRAGYNWTWAGENIGWNSRMNGAGAAQLERLMYSEKAPNNGHRLNILNRHFTEVGVDVLFDHKHHKLWLTTDFGRR